MKKPWTPREEKTLKALYVHYLSGEISKEEITEVFQRSIASIQQKASVLALTNSDTTTINLDALSGLKRRLKIDIDVDEFRKHMRAVK